MSQIFPTPGCAPQGFGDPPVGALMAFAGQLGPANPNAASPASGGQSGAHVTESLEAWGWMLCDGRPLSLYLYPELFAALGYLYGGAGDSFNIPDYRGYFWRGVDDGAGVDPDIAMRTPAPGGDGVKDAVGSTQNFAVQYHEHDYYYAASAAPPGESGDAAGAPLNQSQATFGGPINSTSPPNDVQVSLNETRPVNIYVNYIIKFTAGLLPTIQFTGRPHHQF